MRISSAFAKFILSICINIYFSIILLGTIFFSFGFLPFCYWYDIYDCSNDLEQDICRFEYLQQILLERFYLWLVVSLLLFFAISICFIIYAKLLSKSNIIILIALQAFIIFFTIISYFRGCYD